MKTNHYTCVLLLTLLFLYITSSNEISSIEDTPLSHSNPFRFLSDPSFFLPVSPPRPRPEPNPIIEDTNTGHYLHHLIKAYLGEPQQELKMKLSTAFCGLYVFDKQIFTRGYLANDSSTFQLTTYVSTISTFKGRVVKDNLKFTSHQIDKYSFLLVNLYPGEGKTYDGAIGFGHNCDTTEAEFNTDVLVDCLKPNANYIKVFWFKIRSDGSGAFTLGEYPSEITNDPKHYKTISVLENKVSSQWLIKLHMIYFDDGQSFSINNSMSFGIDGNMFSVSKEFFDWVINTYFAMEISHQICEVKEDEVVELYCNDNYDYQSRLPLTMSLVIGKWSLKIKTKDLFKKVNSNELWFAILYYPKKDQFYLSQKLVGPAITVYDREKQQIGIYYIDN